MTTTSVEIAGSVLQADVRIFQSKPGRKRPSPKGNCLGKWPACDQKPKTLGRRRLASQLGKMVTSHLILRTHCVTCPTRLPFRSAGSSGLSSHQLIRNIFSSKLVGWNRQSDDDGLKIHEQMWTMMHTPRRRDGMLLETLHLGGGGEKSKFAAET